MTGLFDDVARLMEANRRTADGHTYTVPSPETYPYQWLWDSCFHAIILSHLDLAAAKDELRSLVAHQAANGFIGHVTYWEPPDTILKVDWGLPRTSSLVQPPLLALAAWRIFERDTDDAFLREVYPALQHFYGYLLRERDARGVNLLGIVNPDESGEDNSPRFDTLLDLPAQHEALTNTERRYALFDAHRRCGYVAACTSASFWCEDVPFNAITLQNLRTMADIATVLGATHDAKEYRAEAIRLADAMRTHMLHDGHYYSLLGLDGVRDTHRTWARFAPLFAGLYSHRDATRLVEEELQNEATFWLPHGVPTVAKDDPTYDPNEPTHGAPWQRPHWRGPTWMAVHWFLYQSLTQYGFTRAAAEIKAKSLALLEQNGFREYFHPETGVGGGARNFTWGALVIDMQ